MKPLRRSVSVGRRMRNKISHSSSPSTPLSRSISKVPFADLLRQSVHSRLAGYENLNDSNEVRLWQIVLAYNLGNLWRRLVLPKRVDNWSLTSLQQRLVKTGGRLVKHARYYWLLLAESHLTRRLFGAMLDRIARLPVPTG